MTNTKSRMHLNWMVSVKMQFDCSSEKYVFGTVFIRIRGVTNSHCHSGKQRNDASKSDCFKDCFLLKSISRLCCLK